MRDTIDMAREADCHRDECGFAECDINTIKAFEALVRADERDRAMRENAYVQAEREACAKECEHTAVRMGSEWMAHHCAAAIRARGNT
jgi:hypothetical protein